MIIWLHKVQIEPFAPRIIMIEPVTNTLISDDFCSLNIYRVSGNAPRRIVIIQEAYDKGPYEEVCQENIYRITRTLVTDGGIRLICVEGEEGTIDRSKISLAASVPIEKLIHLLSFSAGIAKTMAAGDLSGCIAIGVDSKELIKQQADVLKRLGSARPAREEQLQQIIRWMRSIRSELYPEELQRVSDHLFRFYKADFEVLRPAQHFCSVASSVGIDLSSYDLVTEYCNIYHFLEDNSIVEHVGIEKTAWIQMLAERLSKCWRPFYTEKVINLLDTDQEITLQIDKISAPE